ncbi:hypothetical protein LAZ67_2006345 [Cordylochernes scorpioides]|uniref:Uncharacterized protein n=1 Tax=Cordylochernes scorpioides TaxID=51811 RepID=A0ABY6K9T3_9ARAC|nr:hypothetical protein LAZ67_2006345 [Cordylochernes scorpioides]
MYNEYDASTTAAEFGEESPVGLQRHHHFTIYEDNVDYVLHLCGVGFLSSLKAPSKVPRGITAMRIAFRHEPIARARSLFAPHQFPTKDTSLVSLVLAEQPLVMELPLVSPASLELRSVIRFLAEKNNSAKVIHTELY